MTDVFKLSNYYPKVLKKVHLSDLYRPLYLSLSSVLSAQNSRIIFHCWAIIVAIVQWCPGLFYLSILQQGQNPSPNTITNSPLALFHSKITLSYTLKYQNTVITMQEITQFAFLVLVQSALFNSHVTFNPPTFKCKTDTAKTFFLNFLHLWIISIINKVLLKYFLSIILFRLILEYYKNAQNQDYLNTISMVIICYLHWIRPSKNSVYYNVYLCIFVYLHLLK